MKSTIKYRLYLKMFGTWAMLFYILFESFMHSNDCTQGKKIERREKIKQKQKK